MQQWHQECVDWSVIFGDIEVSIGVDTALIPFLSVSAAMNQLFSARITLLRIVCFIARDVS